MGINGSAVAVDTKREYISLCKTNFSHANSDGPAVCG